MITELIEKRVRVYVPKVRGKDQEQFLAAIQDSQVVQINPLPNKPTDGEIRTYITFLNEVLEAMGCDTQEGS